MKDSEVLHCLSFELLRFVRDERLSEAGVAERLSREDQVRYHVLRKAGVLLLEDGMVRISPAHSSPDGKRVWFGNRMLHLDRGTMDVF